MLPKCQPVPCVAVAVAPAIDWYAMSPMFSRASPRWSSSSHSCESAMPASTVMVRASGSCRMTRP
jgi:hypothetical protein